MCVGPRRSGCDGRLQEHNHIGELSTLFLALRHLACNSRAWDKRFLLITDSLVSLGVLAKGRSALWPLLRLARQAAAIVMTFGIRPYYQYVEYKINTLTGLRADYRLASRQLWWRHAIAAWIL